MRTYGEVKCRSLICLRTFNFLKSIINTFFSSINTQCKNKDTKNYYFNDWLHIIKTSDFSKCYRNVKILRSNKLNSVGEKFKYSIAFTY